MAIRALDNETSRILHSGQVITDLESIVKELVENALDAQATSIEVKLVDNGVDAIHVQDNGKGIVEQDRPFMAQKYHTSKISSFEDISTLHSYGFRGEALNSICAVAKSMAITTKSQTDAFGKQYELDITGSVTGEKIANTIANSGTIIVVNEPFAQLPVRRRIIKKDAATEVKKIKSLLITYGISNPNVRLSLVHHGKGNSWIKPVSNDIEASLLSVYGGLLYNMVERHTLTQEEGESPLTLDMIIPKNISDPSMIYKGDSVFFFVNGRPINYAKSELKDVVTLMRRYYREAIGLNEASSARKTPFMYIDIQLKPDEYDVNIEPNKTAVLFHNKQRIIDMIESVLQEAYPKKIDTFFNQAKKTTNPIESLITVPISLEEQNKASSTDATHEKDVALDTSARGQSKEPSITNIAESSTSHKNPNTGWNFSMMNQEEVDELIDDSDGSETDPKGKGHAVQTASRSPKAVHQSVPASPPAPPGHRSLNINRNKTTSHSDQQHGRSSVQTTLTSPNTISQPRNVPLNTTRDPQTHSSRKRAHSNTNDTPNITSMLTSQVSRSNRSLYDTRNQTMVVDCDFDSIKQDYEASAEHRARYRNMKINDYLVLNRSDQSDPLQYVTNLIKHPELSEKGLAFYTRGILHDQRIYELGVLKIDELASATVYDTLIKKHPLICKRHLERPVQLRIDTNDSLYSVMILLQNKQQQIQDDLHGATHQTYTVITDKRIVHNGFQARWRKDDHSDCILVQLTSIYSLGSSYGVGDFRELLTNISEQPYDEDNLELIRPQKVVHYYQAMAQNYSSTGETEKVQLNLALESLNWNKLPSTRWMMGSLKGKVQAMKLMEQ